MRSGVVCLDVDLGVNLRASDLEEAVVKILPANRRMHTRRRSSGCNLIMGCSGPPVARVVDAMTRSRRIGQPRVRALDCT